jgi:uncharacterized RDD family membrane protein YckC
VTQPPPTYPPPSYPPPPGGYSVPPQLAYPPPGYGYRPAPTGPGGAPLAEFWERLVAYLLDSLIMGAVMLVPMIVVFIVSFTWTFDRIHALRPGEQPDLGPFLVLYAVILAIVLPVQFLVRYLYQVTFQVRRGQTVGKRVMKIKIVDLAAGTPMAVGPARKRWLLESVVGIFGIFAYLDGLWQLWDKPYRQCLHDKWAQTVVVKVPA